MKKLVLLIVIIACVLVFGPKPGHAASELEVWCLAEGHTWEPVTSTCTVTEGSSLYPGLTVLVGETIDINGSGANSGVIDNDGAIFSNYGTIDIKNGDIRNRVSGGNIGIIENYGTIEINGFFEDGTGYDGIIWNSSIIDNKNGGVIMISERGSISNSGTINNHGTINNDGGIGNDALAGKITNYSTINNSGGIVNNDAIDNKIGGVIAISEGGFIYNNDTINNYGTFDNYGTINNWDINGGTINNNGIIYNYCSGIYEGALPNGNPIDYSRCTYLYLYLPMIKR